MHVKLWGWGIVGAGMVMTGTVKPVAHFLLWLCGVQHVESPLW
jgi:hypothetical protein